MKRLSLIVLLAVVTSAVGAPLESPRPVPTAFASEIPFRERASPPDQQTPPGQPGLPPIPTSRPITVTRGGQTVQTITFETEQAPDGRLMRAGSLVVRMRPNVAPTRRSQVHQVAGAIEIGRAGRDDTFRVQVPRGSAAQAIAVYRADADVERVEPDYVRRALFTPNDPSFASQYGLAQISATAAWDRTHGSANVKVAILDCGIYGPTSQFVGPDGFGHRDVRDKIVSEIDLSGSPFFTDDICNHGTHVAGIAAASTNNGAGIAGVGYDTSIMNVKVLDDSGSASISTVNAGIRSAADGGAKVINMSLGGPGACTQSEQDAIDYAWGRGVVIVAAAGNDGLGASSAPGNCNHVISVAATNSSDTRALFSNFGTEVDVAAPGDAILSANYVGTYEPKSGTSMSAPHVSGLAGLLWGAGAQSNQAVVDAIFQKADAVSGTGSLWAHGRINASASVALILTPAPSPRVAPANRSSSGAAPTAVPGASPSTRGNDGAAPGAVPNLVPSGR